MKKFAFVLGLVAVACLLAPVLAPYPPGTLDAAAINQAPSAQHLLGTDKLGRDLLSMLLYGGRSSLAIGGLAAAVSGFVAMVYGGLSAMGGKWMDEAMMRGCDLLLSIPSILLILFLQAMWGEASVLSLGLLIGCTGWMQMAKLVRTEVLQMRSSDYLKAVRTFGGGFWYILLHHLVRNLFPTLLYLCVSAMGQAMMTESTLSFLGLGLPLTEVSWGSLMSLSQGVLLTGNWWILLIPGLVLVTTLTCVTELGEGIRGRNTRLHSHL